MDTNTNREPVTGGRANRYELRSKRKKCPEPKLKDGKSQVKEVNGTKGRKKRAVLSTSTPAAASVGVHVADHGSGDLASAQMTFSIDHIREQIFRSLFNRDLNNCRLVCRSWNSFASLELQRRIGRISCHFGKKECSQFLGLLDKRPESMLGLPLPYSNFWFCKETYSPTFLKNRAMLKLLDKYGAAIKGLSFKCESFSTQPDEKEVIDFVMNLLLHQTPNLSKLKIKLDFYSTCWVEGGATREWDSTLLASDPEFTEIHSKTWGTNTKLKVLSLAGVSAKLLEVIIKLAPNLREIHSKSPQSEGYYCKFFMEPLNRLGHLKKLDFYPNSVEELPVFEKCCELFQSGGTSLKLRKISFGFAFDELNEENASPDVWVRGKKIVNCLLGCSWDSLETITWFPSIGLVGLKWPGVMPNVQKFTIGVLLDNVFALGFSWSTTFPKLRSLSVDDFIGRPSFTTVMDLLFQKQKFESVKDVHVHADHNWSKEDRLTGAQLKRFQNIFPNAEIDISVPFSCGPIGTNNKLKLQKRCSCF